MDPDAGLTELRTLVAAWHDGTLPAEHAATTLGRIADLIDSMDRWFGKGGYLPMRWLPAAPSRVLVGDD